MAKEYPVRRPVQSPPIHPGEVLRDEVLPALRLSVTEARKMRWYDRVVLVLTSISVVWSVVIGVWIAFTPLWDQGMVSGAVLVPPLLAIFGTWAAWKRRRVGVVVSAVLFAAFTLVTGFSIGNAYVPAAGLLVLGAALPAIGHLAVRK